jgi:predicted anti-sigma-YlaC factor YlaD
MISECSEWQRQIPRSLLGDLTAEEQRALDAHVSACPSCQQERESYAQTLRMLQSAGDEPLPRHFLVYPQESSAKPWQLFRQMMPIWQAATVATAALVLLVGIATVSGLQIRSDRGSWSISLGRSTMSPAIDLAALKAEILQTADEKNRQADLAWVQDLRSEMTQFYTDLTQQQQAQLLAALTALQSRLNSHITLTADDIRAGTQKSIVDLYQAVSLQRQEDLNGLNVRLDKIVEDNEIRARQTDAILETLLQIANLNIKQAGDQK